MKEIPWWNRPENKDWAVVAESDGEVIANLSFALFDNVIRGRKLPIAGVWGLTTEPHHRMKGVVKSLYAKAFPMMKELGLVISILDPFYTPFYESFGYASAERYVKHSFPNHILKHVKGQKGVTTREIKDPNEAESLLEIPKSMSRFGSCIFEPKAIIERRIRKGHFHVFEVDKKPIGYVGFSYKRYENRNLELIVSQPVFTDDRLIPSIIKLVGQYALAANKVIWFTNVDFPLRYYITDTDEMITQAIGKMMMRVVDFENYCETIEIPTSAIDKVTLKIEDAHCEWNNGTFELKPTEGHLDIEKLESDASAEVILSEYKLSQVIAGKYPATTLMELGELDCSVATAERLESIFHKDNFVSLFRF